MFDPDPALLLRMRCDAAEPVAHSEALAMLRRSPLVQALTAQPQQRPLAMVWRLVACSELPFMGELPYTQDLVRRVLDRLWCGQAFSLDGTAANVLPCYHAMVLRALLRLGYQGPQLEQGMAWILRYQPFARQQGSAWAEKGVQKYGACFKATPCYIGLVKSAKALVAYQERSPSEPVRQRIDTAMEYVLSHHLAYRLSVDQPVHPHMLDLVFPECYQLNIVELMQLAYDTGRMGDPRTAKARQWLAAQRSTPGQWRRSPPYRAPGFLPFDRAGAHAPWLSYVLARCLAVVPEVPQRPSFPRA